MADKPKVFVAMNLFESAKQIVNESCDATYWQGKVAPTPAEFVQQLADKVGYLGSGLKVTGEVMDKAPKLRVVSNHGVGYDPVDVDAATERGILVGNTPGVLSETTADLAWSLLMAAGRRLGEGDRFVRSGQWGQGMRANLMAYDVHHATLGIFGMGRIGIEMAKRAQAFNMRILYHDVVHNEIAEKQHGATFVDRETLLREADYLTLHTPLMPSTYHLIGEAEFALMKPSAVLVNASRGPVVDPVALHKALTTGQIRAAGLDVFEPEPPRPDDPLLKLENCYLAPHVGSATFETREKMAILAAQNLVAGVFGQPLPAMVNPEALGRGRNAKS